MTPRHKLALVLTGGGARGAYQVGVLRGLLDLLTDPKTLPFSIVTGVSAGAINAVAIGSRADDFAYGVERLWKLWAELDSTHVFRSDPVSIGSIGARWMKDLALGGLTGSTTSSHLLDTTPLRHMLAREMDLPRLAANVGSGVLEGVAISATNYASGTAVSFYDAPRELRVQGVIPRGAS